MGAPSITVVRNEVEGDDEYHCDALADRFDGAAEGTSRLVEADFADDPLFDGVAPVVTAAHGDVVTDPGEGMEVAASADYYAAFGTRHRSAPLWTANRYSDPYERAKIGLPVSP